jgi:two-component system OmpR family response regulator
MTDQVAIIAPYDEWWVSMEREFSAVSIDLTMIRKLELFQDHHLNPSDTVVVIDADQNIDRRANFISGLVRNRFVGVIMISRELSLADRVALTCLGADHCLVRPIDGEELAAIANNMFRHSRQTAAAARRDEQAASWLLDLKQWRLITPRGGEVRLSAAEMTLLAPLFREPGKTHLRCALRGQGGAAPEAGDDRSIDVQISRLRRKVEETSSMALPVRSARGAGYVFASSAAIIPAEAGDDERHLPSKPG